jgi:DNA mismatch repair protein MutS2
LGELIETSLDSSGAVRDEATPRLAKLRSRLRTLEVFVVRRMEDLMRSGRLRPHLQAGEVLYRDGRPVLPVRSEHRGEVRGIVHDRSHTGSTVFVEPEELIPVGDEMEDLRNKESREVLRVLWTLSRSALKHEEALVRNVRVLALFDLLSASAGMALAFRMTLPEVGGSLLRLRDTRHPLLQWIAGDVEMPGDGAPRRGPAPVPLDLRLGEGFHVLVITGPNTGGKTVVLKTVGLICLMAKAGLPVPAGSGTRIPLFRRVLIDVGDEQSLEQSLSTFSSHMKRIVRILEESDVDTLVLLDELGSGTDPGEGAAIGEALLGHLHRRHIPTLVTTHLSRLKAFAFTHPGAENASMEFDSETLRPTFRLILGSPGRSNAIAVARQLGLDSHLLDDAERILGEESKGRPELFEKIETSRLELEGVRRAEEDAREEAVRLKTLYEERLKEVEEGRARFRVEAESQIEGTMRRARERLERLLDDFRSAPQPYADMADGVRRAVNEEFQMTPIAVRRREYIEALRKEDPVYLARLNQKGIVLRVDKKRERLHVQVGAVKMEVPFDDVGPPPWGRP